MKALVFKSTGSWYDVKDQSGKKWKARLKGLLRIDNITSTNPIAVGDWVEMEPEEGKEDVANISGIEDRRNYISRQSPHNKNLHHIVASNLDQSLLIATIKDPRTSQGFIDRFLIASEAYHVPAIIVFNKADTWRKKELLHFNQWKEMYEAIGYKVVNMSLQTKNGLEEVKSLLSGKTTLLSGHSGVGKSSFLNAVLPGLVLDTKAVSGWSGKGMHTTTFAEMFELPGDGKVIDTPGVREFGIVHISRQELSHYFPEMRSLINHCQFNNCIHINEPGCAVKASVATSGNTTDAESKANINENRYISYLSILESIPEKNW
ncbi:MAG: ribosome small subunit-dependent GTPase A [Bacteroidota bacterium]